MRVRGLEEVLGVPGVRSVTSWHVPGFTGQCGKLSTVHGPSDGGRLRK